MLADQLGDRQSAGGGLVWEGGWKGTGSKHKRYLVLPWRRSYRPSSSRRIGWRQSGGGGSDGGGLRQEGRQSTVFILIRDAPRVLSLSGEDARLLGSGGADAAALRLRWRRST